MRPAAPAKVCLWCVGALAYMRPASAQQPPPTAQSAPLSPRDAAGKPPVSDKQKAIEADTEKLVQMAAELKVSVDKSNKNELSLDVVRKAEAVEKLARSLKERIRAAQ